MNVIEQFKKGYKIKKYQNPNGPLKPARIYLNGKWVDLESHGDGNLSAGGRQFKVKTKPTSATGNNEIVITPKGTTVQSVTKNNRYKNKYNSAFHSEDIIPFINTITLGGLNNLSPTQWARRMYDTKELLSGNMNWSNYTNSWINGNNGIITDKFAQEHPYWSTGLNFAGDAFAFGLGQTVRGGSANAFYKNVTADMTSKPGVYYHGSPGRNIETFVPGKDGGIYFTTSKKAARGYTGTFGTGRIYEANLDLGDTSVIIDAEGKPWTAIPEDYVARGFNMPKENIHSILGHYNAGAQKWYEDFLIPFGYKPKNYNYAIDNIVKLGKETGKSSVIIKNVNDTGKGLFSGIKGKKYDQVIVYDPKQIRLLDNISHIK